MSKRKKSKWGMILVVGLFIYFLYVMIDQQTALNHYHKDLRSMEEKIEEQAQLNEELKRKKEILDSNEYVEEVAREKLGLVKEGEKKFVDVNK